MPLSKSAILKRFQQLFLYAGTAGIAAVVDVGGFLLLHEFGLTLALAAAVSFLIATVFNYLLTARFVFNSPINGRGYLRFLSAASLGFIINVGATAGIVLMWGLPPVVAKTIGVGLAFFANFMLNAVFVFRPNSNQIRNASKNTNP